MQAFRIRVTRTVLASALLLGLVARLEAQVSEARESPAQRRELAVALEPVRAPLLPRLVGGALLLVVVLGALGRRRARAEAARADGVDRGGPT